MVKEKAKQFLLENGIYQNFKGFNYFLKAVDYVKKSKKNHIALNEELYPVIASIFNTTTFAIERDIRYLIKKLSIDVCKNYGLKANLTVGELINYFANYEEEGE